ncbi:MAG: cystathionine gamma-synthase [Elusimicrobiota bacterium]
MSDKFEKMRFDTKAVHAGQAPDSATGAIMTPIYQTSTYVQQAPGRHKGFAYARTHHPTRLALERNIAALENAKYGVCFASGMAAVSAVIQLLSAGDHVVSGDDLYGGTYRVFTKVFARFGISFSFANTTLLRPVDKAFTRKTRLLWIETPSNPMLQITDIQAQCDLAHGNKALVAVDNTFATPYLQRPLDLGADLVVHSTTKYLGGHSDAVGGAVVTNNVKLYEELRSLQNATGAVPGPLDCFLFLRGIKTLGLRMDRHCDNALRIAEELQEHAEVLRVHYPGLPEHPGHELAEDQMLRYGGMLAFELRGGLKRALKMMQECRVFALAESLGGVESLIGHPATMTHAAIPRKERLKSGVSDGLIRLSVGIEDAEDLIEDLNRAIARSGKSR